MGEECIIVRLEPRTRSLPSSESLHQRFALTKQETRVALLLTEGRSDAEIATELALSWHTVRRHVERVLQKLGARSRTQAAVKILST